MGEGCRATTGKDDAKRASCKPARQAPHRLSVRATIDDDVDLARLEPLEDARLQTWAKHERATQLANFDRVLQGFCTARNVTLSGRFPAYMVDRFIRVHLALDKGECLVGNDAVGLGG